MPKLILNFGLMILAGLGLVACGQASELPQPTLIPVQLPSENRGITLAQYAAPKGKPHDLARQTCVYPAGWQAYTLGEQDTPASVAARFGISLDSLLASNCIADPAFLVQGLVIYVPTPRTAQNQTILPLAVTEFSADPPQADPQQVITLTWAGQGAIRNVRVGSLYEGQYTELANHLPANGTLQVSVPDDGRDVLSYVVIVGDGAQEVYAQTSVAVSCEQAWFFTPSPSGCPSALLSSEFVEQRFVNGTVVYIPALGLHYVMIRGQEAVIIEDTFVPGISPLNTGFAVPKGFVLPHGALLHLWQNETVQQALGFAVENASRYAGYLQRTMSPSGEVMYLSSSSGDIYRMGKGLVWGVIVTE